MEPRPLLLEELVDEVELVGELLLLVEEEPEGDVELEELALEEVPKRLVAERNAEEALTAVPALAAPVPNVVELPAAGVVVLPVVFEEEEDELLELLALDEPPPLLLIPRSRGAIMRLYRSAAVTPLRRRVRCKAPV